MKDSILDNLKFDMIMSGNRGRVTVTEKSLLLDILNEESTEGELKSPRSNLILLVGGITVFIVMLIAILVFFFKSVLLFRADNGMNEQGAIMISQSCGREHYMYLFNTADCWANTGIKVLKGDKVLVSASGSFYSDIGDMYQCALDNSYPAFSRSLVCCNRKSSNQQTTSKLDSITKGIWMYHEADARFGSLLLQIKEEHTPPSFSSDGGNIQQILFKKGHLPHITVKRSGLLYFAVNDVSLTDEVIKTISKDSVLRKELKLNESIKLDSLWQERDVRNIWFNDNVGEIYLNIMVVRDKMPTNIPMPNWVVKFYRWFELKFLYDYY